MEQPTFCSVVGVRRNEGKPHPPQPFDMYHVTGICEIEKDPVPSLDRVQVCPSLTQEPHGVQPIPRQVVCAQHPDDADVWSLRHDTPHAHGPAVPANHGHAGITGEKAVQQGFLWRVARLGPHFCDVLLSHELRHVRDISDPGGPGVRRCHRRAARVWYQPSHSAD